MLNDQMVANSPTIARYKQKMSECIKLIYPQLMDYDINELVDYSINKRFYNYDKSSIDNSYMKAEVNQTLLEIADYIALREPIVTAYGTMFKHHEVVPNPLATVVQSFLDARTNHKKQMFKYPKGSEQFEKYNLLQSLDKIDTNGLEIAPNYRIAALA